MKNLTDIDQLDFSKVSSFKPNKYLVDSLPLSDEQFRQSLKPNNTSVSVDLVMKEIPFEAKKYI